MASETVLQRLEAEFDASPESIRAVVALLEAGAPPQFISRFRRDETGDPGEDRLCAIEERWHFLQDLEARKAAILEQATAQGKVTPDLEETLALSQDQDLLDDIYQTFRPRRRTAGVQAIEKGLGSLAEAVHHRVLGDKTYQQAAEEYVSEEQGLPTVEAVLEGVLHILAERYAADPKLRARIRDELSRGILKATATAPGRKGAKRYQEFFAFEEPVRRISASRMLALRKAEWQGIIKVELCLPEGRELEIFREHFASDLTADDPLRPFLDLAFSHAYEQLVRAACESDIRRRTKEKADRETVRTHARNLRSQLLSPPLGHKRALAVRASTRTVWIVALHEDGSVATQETLHLAGPQRKGAAAEKRGEPAPEAEKAPEAEGEPSAATPSQAAAPPAESPAAESPAAEAPADEAPADEAPADEAPAAEAPAAEAVALETAVAATRTTEPPATEAPAPEAPSAETPATDTPATETKSAEVPAPESEPAPDSAEPAASEKPPDRTWTREEAVERLAQIIQEHRPAGIAIPHGRRQELAEDLVGAALDRAEGVDAMRIPVDETLSAIFATSPAGRKALPGTEVGLRTGISLARRLQDPMLELLHMNPREVGHGPSLADVHQGILNRQLDVAIASCLAHVGLDLNRASTDTLSRLPGLDRETARKIVDHRRQQGGFKNLAELLSVDGLDEGAFAHVAGFLRIEGGDEPLDATALHPESYELARRIATDLGTPLTDLLGKSLRHVDINQYVTPETGRLQVLDVLRALSSVGRDPRGALTAWTNDGVKTIDDLRVDMHLRGRVTNLTDFGAFVDLGVGQDGLVHISQIPPSRLRDPDRTLRVGEVIQVYVVKVDKQGKRISLTMHKPRHLVEGRQPTVAERMGGRKGRGRRRDEAPVMSRAARAPEGRRGDRRGGPRRPGARDGGRGPRDDGGRRGGHRGDRGGHGGAPRVFTVESDKPIEQSRGHKGELTSLQGLRNLLAGSGNEDKDTGEGAGSSES